MSESPDKSAPSFEQWLRIVCFQKPTPEAYDLAKCAWQEVESRTQRPAPLEVMRQAKEAIEDDEALLEQFYAKVVAESDSFFASEAELAAADYFRFGYRAAIANLEAAMKEGE